MDDLKIFAAPLQGYTEAPWRRAHSMVFGGVDRYFTPFVRVEKGAVRQRDLRDAVSPLDDRADVVAQAIFSDVDELRIIVDELSGRGVRRIDLNMGCPFPLQCRKGRGAALVERPETVASVADYLRSVENVEFSIKMRLGYDRADAWRDVLPIFNDVRLAHLTVHPRTARQEYSGELHYGEFGRLLRVSANPVVYNGDLCSIEDVMMVRDRYPDLAGVMLGRGLLSRPSLGLELRSGKAVPDDMVVDGLLRVHDEIFRYYKSTLCGDSQILMKMKPFWDYPQILIGRKGWKPIHKATGLDRYLAAVDSLRR